MSQRINLSELISVLPDRIDLFICCASFEKRSISVASHLNPLNIQASIIFQIEELTEISNSNYQELFDLLKEKTVKKLLSSSFPLNSADILSEALDEVLRNEGSTIVVDITTFTKETLLMLLNLLWNWHKKDTQRKVIFVYNPAESMSSEWLSKGMVELRSVVGYSGLLGSAKPIHAVVLAGFEIDRARDVLDVLEPDLISIGAGKHNESVTPEFFEKNREFVSELVSYYGANVRQFDFSLIDPEKTKQDVGAYINSFPEYGTTIIPLNNKISTLGVGLLALERQELQICYSRMANYNLDYSVPSNQCIIFSLEKI